MLSEEATVSILRDNFEIFCLADNIPTRQKVKFAFLPIQLKKLVHNPSTDGWHFEYYGYAWFKKYIQFEEELAPMAWYIVSRLSYSQGLFEILAK